MNIRQTFDQIFTRDYSERCPSWLEYRNSAPVEQRAIKARWQQIVATEKQSSFYFDAMESLRSARGPIIPIDNKNPADRDNPFESSYAHWARGEEYDVPDTDEDCGL